MQEHVAVRVAAQAFIVGQRNAANDQRDAMAKLMRVEAIADADSGLRVSGFWFRIFFGRCDLERPFN
jgi:hypothetical protein